MPAFDFPRLLYYIDGQTSRRHRPRRTDRAETEVVGCGTENCDSLISREISRRTTLGGRVPHPLASVSEVVNFGPVTRRFL